MNEKVALNCEMKKGTSIPIDSSKMTSLHPRTPSPGDLQLPQTHKPVYILPLHPHTTYSSLVEGLAEAAVRTWPSELVAKRALESLMAESTPGNKWNQK